MTDDGIYRYYYDCENRLIEVNDQNDNRVVSYGYDYLGRRTGKTLYAPQKTMYYVYDGGRIIAEYEDGRLIRKYIYGPGIDEPVCMIAVEGDEAVYYYHYDGLGSVVALSDIGGGVVERYHYDVFGLPTLTGSVGNRFMFTGREYDFETGLYYYRARYYKPSIGRFLQPDPIGYNGGSNLYIYCRSNPINYVDPRGELWGYIIAGAAVIGTGIAYVIDPWIELSYDPGGAVATTHGPFTFYGPEFKALPPVLQDATRVHERHHKYKQFTFWPWNKLEREVDAYRAERRWLEKRKKKAEEDNDQETIDVINSEIEFIDSMLENDAALLKRSYGIK